MEKSLKTHKKRFVMFLRISNVYYQEDGDWGICCGFRPAAGGKVFPLQVLQETSCINLSYCRFEKLVLIYLFIKLIMRTGPRSASS